MKLLLDENLPHRLRPLIVGHDCETVTYRGWNSKKNGELLQLAADAGFDALVTKDGNLTYQQDVKNLPLAVVVLVSLSNDIDDLRPLVPRLLDALKSLKAKQVTFVS